MNYTPSSYSSSSYSSSIGASSTYTPSSIVPDMYWASRNFPRYVKLPQALQTSVTFLCLTIDGIPHEGISDDARMDNVLAIIEIIPYFSYSSRLIEKLLDYAVKVSTVLSDPENWITLDLICKMAATEIDTVVFPHAISVRLKALLSSPNRSGALVSDYLPRKTRLAIVNSIRRAYPALPDYIQEVMKEICVLCGCDDVPDDPTERKTEE